MLEKIQTLKNGKTVLTSTAEVMVCTVHANTGITRNISALDTLILCAKKAQLIQTDWALIHKHFRVLEVTILLVSWHSWH